MSYLRRGLKLVLSWKPTEQLVAELFLHLRRTASTFALGFFICIQGQSGGNRKKQTGKTWVESSAGIWESRQTSKGMGLNPQVWSKPLWAPPLFVPFWGHFIFSSTHLCIHAPHTSAAVWCRGLSLLDHLVSLMWCQPAALKTILSLKVCLRKKTLVDILPLSESKAASELEAQAKTFL